MSTPAASLPAAEVTKWTGLFRSVAPFAIAPGAMRRADNVVVPGPSLLRPRRGFRDAPIAFGNTRVDALGFYGGNVVYTTPAFPSGYVASSLTSSAAITRGASDFQFAPAVLSAYGPTVPALATRTRFLGANGNLYATTNFGLARTDVPEFPAFASWSPAGLDQPVLALFFNLTAGTLLPALGSTVDGVAYPAGSACAYRFTYRWADANGNEHRGPVSDRMYVQNTSGAASNVLVVALPSTMVLPGTVIETWRTAVVAIPSNGSDAAGDECFKVDERPVTGTAGPAGYLVPVALSTPFLSFTDATPSVPFLVEPLYTNPTTGAVNGLGIANANTPPPACADTFTFKGRTYFLNTQEVERLTAQVIGTGPGGIVDGDTFFVDGVGFQWKTTLAADPGFFRAQLETSSGPVENIRRSASGAALAINTAFGALFGYVTESPATALARQIRGDPGVAHGLPGYVNMRRLVPGAPAFSITPGVGAGRGWAGALATNNTSDANRQPANLMQSQPEDPESVPPAFTNTVGRADAPILRGLALRDAAYVFKGAGSDGAGDGLWRFTDDGTGALQIGPLDQTVNCVAPETVAALDNAAYCLSDKGVLRITDGGAPENISADKIEDDLAGLMAYVGPVTLARVAFAVAYEAEKLLLLALPETPNATTATVQYVYNAQSNAWTRWTIPATTCGGVSVGRGGVADKLFIGRDTTVAGGAILWAERKSLDDSDFQDPGFTAMVPGVGTYTSAVLTFAGDVSASYAPGDLIRYSPDADHSYLLRVTGVAWDVGSNQTTVSLSKPAAWTGGQTLSVIKGIQTALELLPLSDGEPLFDKQWQDVYAFFSRATFDSARLAYATPRQQTPVVYPLAGPTQAPWLYSETLGFGLEPWGGPAHDVVLKLALDQAAARAGSLSLTFEAGDALASWELSALRIPYAPTTSRIVR